MKTITISDMACKCGCGEVKAGEHFLEILNLALIMSGLDVTINSGYRCAKHNAEVGGVPTSAHTKGLAVDLAVPSSQDRFRLVQALLTAGFKRIGLGSNFIHVDEDPSLPPRVMWLY